MKRIVLLLLSVCLGAFCCRAQNLRSWTEGPLSWNDFRPAGPGQVEDPADSYAWFTLLRENKTVKVGEVTYKYQDVSAAIDPRYSWVKTGGMNDAELRRQQQEFDILQYYATQYRDDFMFYTDTRSDRFENYLPTESKHKLSERAYLDEFHSAIDRFRQTGDASAYLVSREVFDITKVPCQIASGASEGIFSLIAVNPTGDLAQLFSTAFGVSWGYGYREGKNYFVADLSLGVMGLSVEKGLMTKRVILSSGSYLALAAKYGRILFSVGNTDFSLFAGAGYTAWKEGSLVSKATVGGPAFTEGICLDYSFHRTFDFLAKKPSAKDLGLQFRAYVDELYVPAQKIVIPSINFALGINLGFRKLTRQ